MCFVWWSCLWPHVTAMCYHLVAQMGPHGPGWPCFHVWWFLRRYCLLAHAPETELEKGVKSLLGALFPDFIASSHFSALSLSFPPLSLENLLGTTL